MKKLDQARELYKQAKLGEAKQLYKEIIKEDSKNVVAMYMLATIQMNQNELKESLATINSAIEIDGKNSDYYQIKGSILARLGETKEALKAIKKALSKNPNLYHAQIIAGHLYFEKADKKMALKHFSMAEKISQHTPEAGVNIAKILIYEGETNKAINGLKGLEDLFPENLDIKVMMGQALIEQGAYSFAESYFNMVISKSPNYDIAKLYLGIAKLSSKDLQEAEKLITQFNQQYPNTKEGLAAFGLLMYKANNHSMAVEYLSKVIKNNLVPTSWQVAYVESLVKLDKFEEAIAFYKRLENKHKDKRAVFRLAELYELSGKIEKAKIQYRKTETTEGKNLATTLGITRIYLSEEKPKKAEKEIKSFFKTNDQQAEALLLLILSLLYQDKQKEALEVLEKINYQNQNDFLKKGFRVQHGLILDDMGKYNEAMNVFSDKNKTEQQPQFQKIKNLSESKLKQLQGLKDKVKSTSKDPVFVIGADSTALNNFISWLYAQGVFVLNDRLVSPGRQDVFYNQMKISEVLKMDKEEVSMEREKYHVKVKEIIPAIDRIPLFVDSLFINPPQLARIKKIFPNARVVLLTRDTADIWLHQKVFGKEPISSKDWNEAVNQIISMNLNLISIEADKWLENDKQTLKELSTIFGKELQNNQEKGQRYWRKTNFPKGHWKNYKEFLGS